MTALEMMCQGTNEGVGAFLARLTEAFDRHSGLSPPARMGETPLSAYESNLKSLFLTRIYPSLSESCCRSCITWKCCTLGDIVQHAEHAEDVERHQGEQKKKKRQERLEDAQLTMYHAMTGSNGQRGGGRGNTDGEIESSGITLCL